MQDINITVKHDAESGKIFIRAPNVTYITQGDNMMQRLVFERPEAFTVSDLVVLFFTPRETFAGQILGQKNKYVIPSVLTQERSLSLKIYYVTDGEKSLNSNNLTMYIRESKQPGEKPIENLPDPITQLKAYIDEQDRAEAEMRANADAALQEQIGTLAPENLVTKTYVDQADADALESAKGYADQEIDRLIIVFGTD